MTELTPEAFERLQTIRRFGELVRSGRIAPAWDGDGTSFAYSAAGDDASTGAWHVGADGARTRLDAPPRPADGQGAAGQRAAGPGTSPDGAQRVIERDHDLWLTWTADGRDERLTDDGTPEVAWRADGAVWSPDGLRLLATRVDTRGVARLPIVHWLNTVEEVEWIPYTKSGGAAATTELFLVDVPRGSRRRVDAGTCPGDFVVPLRWRADGSEALYVTVDRTASRARLCAADPATGSTRVVIDEPSETFVVNIPPAAWAAALPTFVGDDEVLWISDRSGWRHLYRYRLDGGFLNPVTEGELVVNRIVGVDEQRGRVFLVAHTDPERPYDKHVCRVGLDGSGFTVLTTERGVHAPVLSPSGCRLLDTHSAVDRPPRVDLLSSDGGLVATLESADTSALDELGWTPPEEFTAVAADGETELWGVLYHPPDFDPGRLYPVVEFIYAGPQGAIHAQDFLQTRSELANELAQLGFVTVVVDGRGTPERSKAFQDVVHRRFGQFEVAEHAGVMRQLLDERPYLDRERVGITGRSWGGYMTLRALVTEPDLYRAGAMMYGVGDLWDHAAAAIEPYMGLPEDNPDGYRAGDTLALIERLHAPLLIGHGTSDANATFSATMRIVDALVRADKLHQLVVLPEMAHGVEGAAGDHWYRALATFLTHHLRPDVTPVRDRDLATRGAGP